MGKGRRQVGKQSKKTRAQEGGAGVSRQGRGAGRGEEAKQRTSWFAGKRPVLRFVVLFCVCMAVFYGCMATVLFRETLFPAYLRFNAGVSATILRCLGEEAAARETSVASPRFSIEIRRGCDAVEPSAVFLSAVLASPVSMWLKLPGMAAGTVVLMLVNLVRIVSLFYVGIIYPKAFHMMHVDVWQALFIFLALLFWVVWARWARGRGQGSNKPDASV